MKTGLSLSLVLCFVVQALATDAPPAMRNYVIDLPNHVLLFSLPEEIARGVSPMAVDERFDPSDASYLRNDFRQIAGTLYEFKGPFWVGTMGTLGFHFMIQKRSTEYQGGITTIDGLYGYVRSWNEKIDSEASICDYSLSTLNSTPAVRREWNTFNREAAADTYHLEIFSLPLDEEMFLDVGFNIRKWESDNIKKWKKKAEEMRESIKASIVLTPKK